MGNQSVAYKNINVPVQLSNLDSQKLNYSQATFCIRRPHQIQEKIQKEQPIQKYFDNFTDIKFKKYENGNIYIGGLDQQNKPQGYGRIIFTEGSVQTGYFKFGKMNGKGSNFLSDGSTYQGQFQEGKQKGQGIYKKGNYSYQGSFENGTYNGRGRQKNKEPNYQFSGVFEKGIRKQGKLKWINNNNDQCQYNGQFNSNNQFDGYGQLKNAKGVYRGQFKNGRKQGQGKFKFSNGILFVGNYQNGMREGYGTIYNNPKGSKKQQEVPQNISYQGYFEQNAPHGIGCIYDSQLKQMKIGIYQKGDPIRQATDAEKKKYKQSSVYLSPSRVIRKNQQTNNLKKADKNIGQSPILKN